MSHVEVLAATRRHPLFAGRGDAAVLTAPALAGLWRTTVTVAGVAARGPLCADGFDADAALVAHLATTAKTIRAALALLEVTEGASAEETAWRVALAVGPCLADDSYDEAAARGLARALLVGDLDRATRAAVWLAGTTEDRDASLTPVAA